MENHKLTIVVEELGRAAHAQIFLDGKLVATVSASLGEKHGYDGGGSPCVNMNYSLKE